MIRELADVACHIVLRAWGRRGSDGLPNERIRTVRVRREGERRL